MDNATGIFLSRDALMTLDSIVREQVMAAVLGVGSLQSYDAETDDIDEADEHFAELSPAQAKRFIKGCSDKVKLAIETMVRGETNKFQLAHVATALNSEASDLRGVWGGITRRTKTITGDPDAYLISWLDDAEHDDEGNYINQTGEITEMAYRSFRKALRI